jgi:hypothetical protein
MAVSFWVTQLAFAQEDTSEQVTGDVDATESNSSASLDPEEQHPDLLDSTLSADGQLTADNW